MKSKSDKSERKSRSSEESATPPTHKDNGNGKNTEARQNKKLRRNQEKLDQQNDIFGTASSAVETAEENGPSAMKSSDVEPENIHLL